MEDDAQTTIITTDKEYTIPKTTAQEIRNIIDKTKNNRAPGIDLINGKILKNLPPKAIRLMTIIFNAILRIQYFPKPWKLAQIKMLPKAGKDPHQTDDTAILVRHTNPETAVKILQEHIRKCLECSSFRQKEYASFSCFDTLSRIVPLHYPKILLSLHFQCIQSFHCQLRFGLIHTDLLRRYPQNNLHWCWYFVQYLIISLEFTHDC